MPTGYTSDVGEKNISFREYALTCARAFGAAIMQHDDPHGPIKLQKADTSYYEKRLEAEKKSLAKYSAMTLEEADAASLSEYEENQKYTNERIQEIRTLRDRYEAMLAQVNEWTPPTDDHVQFKKFMQEQLTSSINFDCNEEYYTEMLSVPKKTGAQWLTEAKSKAVHDIQYYTDCITEEIERTNKRNEWINALINTV